MAEFLVHGRVPMTCMIGIAVRSESVKGQVRDVLAAHSPELPVLVRPNWYF
jgi:hypothetical protein